jgi:hypothetical protein
MIRTMPMRDHYACYLEMKNLHRRFDLGNEEHPFKIKGKWCMPLKEVCAYFGKFISRNTVLPQKTPFCKAEFNPR